MNPKLQAYEAVDSFIRNNIISSVFFNLNSRKQLKKLHSLQEMIAKYGVEGITMDVDMESEISKWSLAKGSSDLNLSEDSILRGDRFCQTLLMIQSIFRKHRKKLRKVFRQYEQHLEAKVRFLFQ